MARFLIDANLPYRFSLLTGRATGAAARCRLTPIKDRTLCCRLNGRFRQYDQA